MVRTYLLVLAAMLFVANAIAGQPKNAAQQGGKDAGEIKDEQGKFVIRYAISVPKELPAPPQKTLGLILGMHGKGGDEKQQIGAVSQALIANKLAKDYVILGLKSKGEGWADEDHEPICKAIAWALKEYPIDPARVFAWGYSSGAWGIGSFAPRHQNLIAGGVMLAGALHGPPKTTDGEQGVQLYLINGEKDPLATPKGAHDSCDALKAASYRYVYRELIGADHGLGGPGSAPMKQDAIRWIHALRNRLIPLSDADRKAVDEVTAKLKEGKSSPPQAAWQRLLELAGPEVDQTISLACQSERRETRMAAAMLCQQRLYGKPVLDALITLLKDKDQQVRMVALRALGFAAHWQYPEACEALGALAKDATKPDGDRLNAGGQAGTTVPLQLFCVNHDAMIFDTLNELLNDKNPQLKLVAKLGLDGKLLPDAQGFRVKQ